MTSAFLMSILAAGVVAALLMLITRLLLWRTNIVLPSRQLVTIILIEVGLVLTAWAVLANQSATAIAFWGIAGSAAIADVSCAIAGQHIEQYVEGITSNAFRRGRIAGRCDQSEESNGE